MGSSIDAGESNTVCGLQAFCWDNDGRVKLDDGTFNKCLTAAIEESFGKGGRWKKRPLTMEDCTAFDDKYQQWQAYDADGNLKSGGTGCSGDGNLSYNATTECPTNQSTISGSFSLKVSILVTGVLCLF